MLVLLIAIIILPAAITKYNESKNPDERTWQEVQQQSIAANKDIIEEGELPADSLTYFEEQVAISQYRLDNNIAEDNKQTAEGFVQYGVDIIMFITLFVVVVAATIVSSEFSTGTIKCY